MSEVRLTVTPGGQDSTHRTRGNCEGWWMTGREKRSPFGLVNTTGEKGYRKGIGNKIRRSPKDFPPSYHDIES